MDRTRGPTELHIEGAHGSAASTDGSGSFCLKIVMSVGSHLTERADYLSHIVDWQLNPAPHSVDRFASFHNCQLQRFNSRVLEPRV